MSFYFFAFSSLQVCENNHTSIVPVFALIPYSFLLFSNVQELLQLSYKPDIIVVKGTKCLPEMFSSGILGFKYNPYLCFLIDDRVNTYTNPNPSYPVSATSRRSNLSSSSRLQVVPFEIVIDRYNKFSRHQAQRIHKLFKSMFFQYPTESANFFEQDYQNRITTWINIKNAILDGSLFSQDLDSEIDLQIPCYVHIQYSDLFETDFQDIRGFTMPPIPEASYMKNAKFIPQDYATWFLNIPSESVHGTEVLTSFWQQKYHELVKKIELLQQISFDAAANEIVNGSVYNANVQQMYKNVAETNSRSSTRVYSAPVQSERSVLNCENNAFNNMSQTIENTTTLGQKSHTLRLPTEKNARWLDF